MTTHTHAGWIVTQARRRGGRRFDHLNAAGGPARKVHALRADGRDYRAACGEVVRREYGDESDLDGPTTGHVRPAGELAVTCAKCRKLIG
jgi:hypothetical protein